MFKRLLTRNNFSNIIKKPILPQISSNRSYILDFKHHEPFHPIPGRRPVECDSPLEAVRCVQDGHRVYVHGMAATPEVLIDALCVHAKENDLSDIELVHLLTSGNAPQVSDKYKKHFKDTSLFLSNNIRNAVHDGTAEYVPIFLSEIPFLFLSDNYKLDVALLHVSPPDNAGFCSLGVSVDISRAAAGGARLLVGVLNKHMPRTHGDGHVHISQFDYVCEHHAPLGVLSDTKKTPGESERIDEIGRMIAEELVVDGATVQVGIGELAQSVLSRLTNHKDLGIHTEMFGDAMLGLFEKGVITGAKKTQHPGKVCASFVIGSQQLYDFVNDNPRVNLLESNYINDVATIASNPNVIAINNAIEIDITGQCVSDSIGLNIYSGFGGQVDFLRGAAYSHDGKPVIAITSTTHRGESKIVPTLRAGAGVVTTRAHVRYVATEFGIVNLFGKSLKERADLLISIAHPDHRDWLAKQAHKRFKGNWDFVPKTDYPHFRL